MPSLLVDLLISVKERYKDDLPKNFADMPFRNGKWGNIWRNYQKELQLASGGSIDHTPFTAHQLRHTYGSLLIRAGVNIATVSKNLGHSDIHTTLSVYIHELEGGEIETVDKLDCYLKRKSVKVA